MATASDFWNYYFGKGVQNAMDYTGRQIKKAAFNQNGSRYGWILEYILPLDKGGTKNVDNIHIVSYEAHTLREGRISFTIDGNTYQVQKESNGTYQIHKKSDNGTSFWKKEFGNAEIAEDFAGRQIYKGHYGLNSKYAWDIDHIQPLSRGGKDNDTNKQIVHILTNDEKGDKTTFTIDGITYQVKKTSHSYEEDWANYNYSDKKYCIVIVDNEDDY